MTQHNKLDVAARQLETAISLYVSDRDKLSAITLAGAADVILCQLVKNSGEENFIEYCHNSEMKETGITTTPQEFGNHVNDILKINALKHMDPQDEDFVEIDIDLCAFGTIMKAVVNYIYLRGRKDDFIQALFAWIRINIDPERLKQLGWSV